MLPIMASVYIFQTFLKRAWALNMPSLISIFLGEFTVGHMSENSKTLISIGLFQAQFHVITYWCDIFICC